MPILFGPEGPPLALGVSLFYDEIPKYQTDSAQTFFSGAGTGSLTLPSGWTASAADFDNFLYVNEIDHKRRTAGGETLARSCPATSTSTRAISTREREARSSQRR